MADSHIYAKQLLSKRHGYPLWIPEPYGHSAIYRTKGVRIGDVGYVTQDGAFRTLFNIRAPSDHPINRRGVPNGFQQVHLDADDIDRVPNLRPPNSSVTSTYAEKRSLDVGFSATEVQTVVGAGAGLQYVWSSSEGAILHLPKGASRIDATNLNVFREQATYHAKNWYAFAQKHTDITNAVLELSAIAGAVEGHLSYSYSWGALSSASHRVGPSVDDEATISDEDLDSLERDDEIFGVDALQGHNQTAFLRGFKILLKKQVFRRQLFAVATHTPMVLSIKDPMKKHTPRTSFNFLASSFGKRGGGQAKTPGDAQYPNGKWDDVSPNNWPSDNDVYLEDIPGSFEDCHPSTLINNFMLNKYVDAEVAITHDDDWIGLIDEEDQSWLTDDEFLSRLQQRHKLCYSRSVVFPASRLDTRGNNQLPTSPNLLDMMVHLPALKIRRPLLELPLTESPVEHIALALLGPTGIDRIDVSCSDLLLGHTGWSTNVHAKMRDIDIMTAVCMVEQITVLIIVTHSKEETSALVSKATDVARQISNVDASKALAAPYGLYGVYFSRRSRGNVLQSMESHGPHTQLLLGASRVPKQIEFQMNDTGSWGDSHW
ncbi:hypothetical protein AB1N83_006417 [Pleurotus pulmonarius]